MSAVSATLAIIDEDGPAAVSIRRLARDLNYSRSGLAYRIGSMPELELEVFSVAAAQLAQVVVGDGPVRADDPRWIRDAALRVLEWHAEYPNRAQFLIEARIADDLRCPVVADALSAALGRQVDVACASVTYLVSSFALMLDIVRLFDDRDEALDAVASHCAGTWRILVQVAERQPVAA